MAEWLRRSTRNRLGLSRVGSSPAGVEISFSCQIFSSHNITVQQKTNEKKEILSYPFLDSAIQSAAGGACCSFIIMMLFVRILLHPFLNHNFLPQLFWFQANIYIF